MHAGPGRISAQRPRNMKPARRPVLTRSEAKLAESVSTLNDLGDWDAKFEQSEASFSTTDAPPAEPAVDEDEDVTLTLASRIYNNAAAAGPKPTPPSGNSAARSGTLGVSRVMKRRLAMNAIQPQESALSARSRDGAEEAEREISIAFNNKVYRPLVALGASLPSTARPENLPGSEKPIGPQRPAQAPVGGPPTSPPRANNQERDALSPTPVKRPAGMRHTSFRTVQHFIDFVRRWPECDEVVMAVPRHAVDPAARFNPYDLILVEEERRGNVDGEYVSLSAQGAIYHHPDEPPEFTSFEIWVAEMHAMNQLKSLPWLGRFYTWRMFKRFKDNIRSSRYRRNASRFVKSSLLADAGFVSALHRLAPPLMELSDILVTELPPDGQASWLEDFKEVQERRRDWLCDTVWRVYHDTTLLLMTVSWDLLERDKLIDPADAEEMRNAYRSVFETQEDGGGTTSGSRRRKRAMATGGRGAKTQAEAAQKAVAESLVRWSTAARQRGLCRRLVRLYRLAQQLLDTSLYHLSLRFTDELHFLVNAEVDSGAASRAGKQFRRPPSLSQSWLYIDLDLHLDTVPGEGALFSLRPSVDQVVDLLNTMHNAVTAVCVSLRPIIASPAVAPFVQMAGSIERQIVLPASELYTYSSYVGDCVRNAILLSSTSTNWQATADAFSQLNATWVKRVLANQDALLEEYKIRIVDSLYRLYQRLSKRVEKFVAIVEFSREAQAWDPEQVAARIRAGLPWSQAVLDPNLKTVPQEELAERMHEVNEELSRLQALAKRYTRLESSVDSEQQLIQVGPFLLLTTAVNRVLKSTPDSVLHKLRKDLPAIFNSLCAHTLNDAYLVSHKLSRAATTLEQFCEQLHMLDQAEQNINLFQDEVRLLKHYFAFLSSSAFLFNSQAKELAERLPRVEEQLSSVLQQCHTASITHMARFQSQLRQRMDAMHEDVRHLQRTLEERQQAELRLEDKDGVLMALTSLSALKLRVQVVQQQSRRLVTFQQVMSERQQFVCGEAIKIDSFTDVNELHARLTGRIRALDRLLKVRATFEKWMEIKLRDVDIQQMSREFQLAATGFNGSETQAMTTTTTGIASTRFAGLTPSLLKKMKMYIFVTRHLLNTHMSHDNWRRIQRILASSWALKKATKRRQQQTGVGDEEEEDMFENSPTLKQLFSPGAIKDDVNIQDLILQTPVRELVQSPLMDHVEQLFEISVHASVSGIVRMALRNTGLCWSSLPLTFRPASNRQFNTSRFGHVSPSCILGVADHFLLANAPQLSRALELCASLHNMLGQYSCSDENRVGMATWRHALLRMRGFLERWPAIQSHWRQLQQLYGHRETHVALGKDQTRMLEQLLSRCTGALSRLQAHSHLDQFVSSERDLLDHLPSLLDGLTSAAKQARAAVCAKRSACSRLQRLPDAELMELYRTWCSTRDSLLLPVDHHLRAMFPHLDGLLWQPVDADGGGAAISGNVVGVRSVDGVEDVVFGEPLRRDGLTLEAWANAVEDRLFEQVHSRVHQTWAHLQEEDGDWLLPLLFEELQAKGCDALRLVLSQLVVLQLAWTRDVEEGLMLRRPSSLREAADVVAGCQQQLAGGLWTASHARDLHAYSTLAVQMGVYRDITSSLLQQGEALCGKGDFEWRRHLRYYEADASAGQGGKKASLAGGMSRAVRVGLGPWLFDYGYEYRDPRSRLVVPPLTERCLINLATAMRQGKVPHVQDGGARFVTECLAVALGRPLVPLSCGAGWSTLAPMTQALQQVVSGGAVLLLEGLDRLEPALLCGFVEAVLQARDACVQAARRQQAPGKSAYLRHLDLSVKDLHVVVSSQADDNAISPHTPPLSTLDSSLRGLLLPLPSQARRPLPPELQSFLRPVRCLRPGIRQLLESALCAYGLADASAVAEALVGTLELQDDTDDSRGLTALTALRTAFRLTAGRFARTRSSSGPREPACQRRFCSDLMTELWSQLEQSMATPQLNMGLLPSRDDMKQDFNSRLLKAKEDGAMSEAGGDVAVTPTAAGEEAEELDLDATVRARQQQQLVAQQSSIQEALQADGEGEGGSAPAVADPEVARELRKMNMTMLLEDGGDFYTDACWVSSNEALLQLVEDSMDNVGLSELRPQAEAVLQVWRAMQANASPCVIVSGAAACGKSSLHRVLHELSRRVAFRSAEKRKAEGMRRILGHLALPVVVRVLKVFTTLVRRFKQAKAARLAASRSPRSLRRQAASRVRDDDGDCGVSGSKPSVSDAETQLELIRHGYLSHRDLVGFVSEEDGAWTDGLLPHHLRRLALRRLPGGDGVSTRFSTAGELGVDDGYQPPAVIALDGPWTPALEEVLLACEPSAGSSSLPTICPYDGPHRTPGVAEPPHRLRLPDGQRLAVPAGITLLVETGSLQRASPASVTQHAVVCLRTAAKDLCDAMLRSFMRRVRSSSLPGEEGAAAVSEPVQTLLARLLLRQDHVQAALAFPDSLLDTRMNYRTSFPPSVSPAMVVSRVSCFLSLLEYALLHTPVELEAAGSSHEPPHVRLSRACSMFLFAYVWGLGSSVGDADDRRAFSEFVRERLLPHFGQGYLDPQGSLFDYVVDFYSPSLVRLGASDPPSWLPSWVLDPAPWASRDPRVASELNGHTDLLLFPTPRTQQAQAVLVYLMKAGRTPWLQGREGCGKTALLTRLLRALGQDVVQPDQVLGSMMGDPSSFEASEEQIGRRMGTTNLKNMVGSFAQRVTELARPDPLARQASNDATAQPAEATAMQKSQALDQAGAPVVRPMDDPLGFDCSFWGNLVSLRVSMDLQRCSSLYVPLESVRQDDDGEDCGEGLQRLLRRHLQRERQWVLEPPPGVHGVLFIDDFHVAAGSAVGKTAPAPPPEATACRELLRGLLDDHHEYGSQAGDGLGKLNGPFVHARPSALTSPPSWSAYPKDSVLNRCSIVSAGRPVSWQGPAVEGSAAGVDAARCLRHLTPVMLDCPHDSELQQVFSVAARSILLRSPITAEAFACYQLENPGAFYTTEINNIMPHLASLTTEFLDTLPLRMDADDAFVLPLLRFDLSSLSRFCRGLALADPVHTSTPAAFTRLWLHELMREVVDRLPPSSEAVRDKVLRMLSTHFGRLPLQDGRMAALQLCLTDASKAPLLWAHVPGLFGAHLRPSHPADVAMTRAIREEDAAEPAYEIKLSYVEVCSALEDVAEDASAAAGSARPDADGGWEALARKASYCFRRRADQKLVVVRKDQAYGLQALRKALRETLTKGGLMDDVSTVTTQAVQLAVRLARLLCVPQGHAVLVGCGHGCGSLIRGVAELMDVRTATLDEGGPPSSGQGGWRGALRAAVCTVLGVNLPAIAAGAKGSVADPPACAWQWGEESLVLMVKHAQDLEPAALRAVCHVMSTGDPSSLFTGSEVQRMVAALAARDLHQQREADDAAALPTITAMRGTAAAAGGRLRDLTVVEQTARGRREQWPTTLRMTQHTARTPPVIKASVAAPTPATASVPADRPEPFDYDVIAGDQMRAEAGLRRIMRTVRTRLRVLVCLDDHLARSSHDGHDYYNNSRRANGPDVGSAQKCGFVSRFLDRYPALQQRCTVLWAPAWSVDDVEEVVADVLDPSTSSGGSVFDACSRLSQVGALPVMHAELVSLPPAEQTAGALYDGWTGVARAVTGMLHEKAAKVLSQRCHSDGLYYELPPSALLRTLHVFRTHARTAAQWYAAQHARLRTAASVLKRLSSEAEGVGSTLTGLKQTIAELGQGMADNRARTAAVAEERRAAEARLAEGLARLAAMQDEVHERRAAAEAVSLEIQIQVEECRRQLGQLTTQDEYLRAYEAWAELVRVEHFPPRHRPSDSAGSHAGGDGRKPSAPTLTRTSKRNLVSGSKPAIAPPDKGLLDSTRTLAGPPPVAEQPAVLALPALAQALLLLLVPPIAPSEPSASAAIDAGLRIRWCQYLLTTRAAETVRTLVTFDVAKVPGACHAPFAELVGSQAEGWASSPVAHVRLLGQWLSAVRTLFADMAAQADVEADCQAAAERMAEVHASNRQLEAAMADADARTEALGKQLAELEAQRGRLHEHVRRYTHVATQGKKVGSYLSDARAVCEARLSTLQRDVTRLPGDLLLLCAAAHYLAECPWRLRVEVVRAWRRACWHEFGVPTSRGEEDLLGVLGDATQARAWTFRLQPPAQPPCEPLLPHHVSWLSSAALSLACGGWPLLIDPSIEQPSLAWLRSVHAAQGHRLVVVPAMHVTAAVIEETATWRDGSHHGAVLVVTDAEVGCSPDLLRLLTSRLRPSDSAELLCYVDGPEASPLLLGPSFRLYVLSRRAPSRTCTSALRCSDNDAAAGPSLADRPLLLPAAALRNLCIVHFAGEPWATRRKGRWHHPLPAGKTPRRASVLSPKRQAQQQQARPSPKQAYSVRGEHSYPSDAGSASALAQALAHTALQQAWGSSGDQQMAAVLDSPAGVVRSHHALKQAEDALLTFLVGLEGPCATGLGLIYRALGREELTVDMLRLLRVDVARTQVQLRGALITEAKVVRTWRSLAPLVSDFAATAERMSEAFRAVLQGGGAGEEPASITLLTLRDPAPSFARALPPRGSKPAKAIEVVTARAAKIKRFSPVLLHARTFLTRFRRRKEGKPATPHAPQARPMLGSPQPTPPITSPKASPAKTKLGSLLQAAAGGGGGAGGGALSPTAARSQMAEHDELAANFPDNVLDGVYRRYHADVAMARLHPDADWVGTLVLVHALYQRRWGLEDDSFLVLLSLLRAHYATSTDAALYFCAAREGHEYVWLHEDVLSAKRRSSSSSSSRPDNVDDTKDGKEQQATEPAEAEKESGKPAFMRGLSLGDTQGSDAWSSSDEEGESVAAEDEEEEGEEEDAGQRFTSIEEGQDDDDEDAAEEEEEAAQSVGKLRPRQLRLATANLMHGGAFVPHDPSAVPLTQRVYGLLHAARDYLDSKPFPQYLRRWARGRRVWRQVVMLEQWIPSRFKGLGQSLTEHGQRWEAWAEELKELLQQREGSAPPTTATEAPPPPSWKGMPCAALDHFHLALLVFVLEPDLLPRLVRLCLAPLLSEAAGADADGPTDTTSLGLVEKTIRAPSNKPIIFALPSPTSHALRHGTFVHRQDPFACLTALAARDSVPMSLVVGLGQTAAAGAAKALTRQLAVVEEGLSKGRWVVIMMGDLNSPAACRLFTWLYPGGGEADLRPDEEGGPWSRLLTVTRHPRHRLIVITSPTSHSPLSASSFTQWLLRTSTTVLWSFNDQSSPPESEQSPAVTAVARLACHAAGISSLDPTYRVICRLHLKIQHVLDTRDGREQLQRSGSPGEVLECTNAMLPALLIHTQTFLLPLLSNLERTSDPDQRARISDAMARHCRDVVRLLYLPFLGDRMLGSPGDQLVDTMATVLCQGLQTRPIPTSPKAASSPRSPSAPWTPGRRGNTTAEAGGSSGKPASLPLLSSRSALASRHAQPASATAPGVEAASPTDASRLEPRSPQSDRSSSVRQAPAFVSNLRINPDI